MCALRSAIVENLVSLVKRQVHPKSQGIAEQKVKNQKQRVQSFIIFEIKKITHRHFYTLKNY